MSFKNNDLKNPEIVKFGPENRLPPGTVMVNLVNDKLIFSTNKGFYRYNHELNRFEPDLFFKDVKIGINPSEYPTVSDKNGNIWANGGKELVFYRRLPEGSYRMEKGSFSRFSGQMINSIRPVDDGSTWFGLSGSIVCYKPSMDEPDHELWNTMIRSVSVSGDRPVYLGGLKSYGYVVAGLKFPYDENDLSFEYAGLSYIKPEFNEFSIMLEGYDKNWSSWSRNTKTNYTNLPPGDYIFRVKCRNITGEEGTESGYSFTIISPWYRTYLAYFGYLLVAVLVVVSIVRFRTRKLKVKIRD